MNQFSEFEALSIRKPPDVIYHYTTRAGLLGIAKDRAIWATNVRYLNDSREVIGAAEIALSVLETRARDTTGSDEKRFVEQFESWITSLKDQFQPYVCSFSENGDLLSQWRAYCEAGDGYAIGFDSVSLRELGRQQGFILTPCEYEEAAQRALLESFFGDALALFRANKISAEQFVPLFCVPEFLKMAPLIKDKCFQEEQEWRLFAPVPKVGDKGFPAGLSFRSGKSMLIPYVPFSLGTREQELPITSVVIGLSPHGPRDSQAVLNLLMLHGAKACSCSWSAIPLRGT